MRPRISITVALAAGLALTGCANTTLLLHRTTRTGGAGPSTTTAATAPAGPSASRYVAQLRAAERTLVTSEQRIPTNTSTPTALAHSATLLAGAVTGLVRSLAAIRPPASVAKDHAHLVAVMQAYGGQLRAAAAMATQPGKLAFATSLLVSATNTASARFGTALTHIYSTLGVAQP
jgi:hypothetical protein